MSRVSPKAATGYTVEEVWDLLSKFGSLSSEVVLVGGQALAFWATYYRARVPVDLLPYVTLDVDFLGTSAHAKAFAEAVPGAKLYVPTLDDHTPSSGRVIARNVMGRTLEVDFLHSMAGVSESDVQRNAVDLKDPHGKLILRVMHPLYCLESRIKNLVLLPGKRDRFGIAQARLAVQVMRLHIAHVLAQDASGLRKTLKLVERLGDLALSEPGKRCYIEYRIDVLRAVPANAIPSSQFQQLRWPQLRRQVTQRRAALRKLIGHPSAPSSRARSRSNP